MEKYEYKVLVFDTSEILSQAKSGFEEHAAIDIEQEIEELGEIGYELKNTNVIGEVMFVFLMRKKP